MPVSTRQITSISAFTENAPANEKALYQTRLNRNALRRPIRSAMLPRQREPKNMPMKADASRSLKSVLCLSIPYSPCSAVPIELTRKISYMSKNRPMPITSTTNRCSEPTGMLSIQPPTVSASEFGEGAASSAAPGADAGEADWALAPRPRSRLLALMASP